MEKNTLIQVTNRDSGTVGYTIPDKGIHRSFMTGESKMIPLSELQELQYVPGGEFTLQNLLLINDKNALEALNMEVEPEYFYTEEDIKKLLLEGSLDQLDDALKFGRKHEGVIEIIKKLAVDLEIPDTRKRKLITQMTGFNIDSAINIIHTMSDENEDETDVAKTEEKSSQRKATPVNAGRKAPVYKVVTKTE